MRKFLSSFKVSSILDILWPDFTFWSTKKPTQREEPGLLDKKRPQK